MPHNPARDNFPAAVIRLLRDRVNQHCSRPQCDAFTSGPGSGPEDVVITGVAAHIHAAAPAGPRYLAEMTRQQRKDIANGIWLCTTCATLVDRDVARYPAEMLRTWKREAEGLADRRRGTRPAHARDAVEELVAAASGRSSRFLPSLIANAHVATATALHALDPRFDIESRYQDGVPSIHLKPRQDVEFSFELPRELAQDWSDGLRLLADHGEQARLPMQGVEVRGLPILAALVERDGAPALFMSSAGLPAVLKLTFKSADGERQVLDDAQGTVTPGRKSSTFRGMACGGLVRLELRLGYDGNRVSASLNAGLVFDNWFGRDVRGLPHFGKTMGLIEAMALQREVTAALEVDGGACISGRITYGAQADEGDAFLELLTYLQYLEKARTVCSATGNSLRLQPGSGFTRRDHEELDRAAALFRGGRRYEARQLRSAPTCTVIAAQDGENIRQILSGRFQDFVFEMASSSVRILGQDVALPVVCHLFKDVRATLVSGSEPFQDGQEIGIAWEAGPDFSWTETLREPVTMAS